MGLWRYNHGIRDDECDCIPCQTGPRREVTTIHDGAFIKIRAETPGLTKCEIIFYPDEAERMIREIAAVAGLTVEVK